MPEPISVSQLQQYKAQVEAGGVDAAVKVYGELYSKGYNYGGWAQGVAKGLRDFPDFRFTGLGALNFLNESFYQDNCRYLTGAEIDKIKKDMALIL